MAGSEGSITRTDNLSSLIEDTVTSLRKDVSCEKAAKIQKAIVTYIEIFLKKVAEEEPLFRVSELLQVGSYAEDTKILQPDEFDFLAVLGELSEPGAIVVDNELHSVSGDMKSPQTSYVTVALATEALKIKWEKYCDNGLLQCFQNVHNRVRFGNVFIKAIQKLYRQNAQAKKTGGLIVSSSTEIDFFNCMFAMPPVDDLSLNLRRVEFKTPNVLLTFELDNQEVSVDLSPAIRYYKVEDCFKTDNCASKVLSEAILDRKSLLLVANRNFYFRVTVTESEVWYITTVMKNEHRIIYMILKYINNLFTKTCYQWNPFSSYMLKNLCITHDINCNNDKVTIASCFVAVIENLSEYCSKFELPSVVNKNVNLFDKPITSKEEELEYREYVIDALRNICRQSKNIHSVEEFKEYLLHHIKETTERFRDMRDEKYAQGLDSDYRLPENYWKDLYEKHTLTSILKTTVLYREAKTTD